MQPQGPAGGPIPSKAHPGCRQKAADGRPGPWEGGGSGGVGARGPREGEASVQAPGVVGPAGPTHHGMRSVREPPPDARCPRPGLTALARPRPHPAERLRPGEERGSATSWFPSSGRQQPHRPRTEGLRASPHHGPPPKTSTRPPGTAVSPSRACRLHPGPPQPLHRTNSPGRT